MGYECIFLLYEKKFLKIGGRISLTYLNIKTFGDHVYHELLESLCDKIRDRYGLENLNGYKFVQLSFARVIYYRVSILNSCPTQYCNK